MKKKPRSQADQASTVPQQHGAALPPDILAAKLDAFRADLTEQITEVVRSLNEQLLKEYAVLKPLMRVQDVAKTLGISSRTVETLIAQGKLRPLWIKGQRRFHTDAIEAYLRSCEKKPRPSSKRQRVSS